MLKNLASSLFLTERDTDEFDDNAPKIRGRIVTTVHKAKEVRPLVEKCVTIARRSLESQRRADELDTSAERNSDAWRTWREGDGWREWNQAVAPVLAARRRCLRLLGDREAVSVLFEKIAERFADRPGGYTRIMRLAQPRLGDAGEQAILEFVGANDRVKSTSQAPQISDDDQPTDDDAPDEVAESSDDDGEASASTVAASVDGGDEDTADADDAKK